MKISGAPLYALRFAVGQQAPQAVSQTSGSFYAAAAPDRVVTRSATCLAVFGIALSSFSLKQMLSNNTNKPNTLPIRKF